MRETIDFVLRQAGCEVGLNSQEIDAILRPQEVYEYSSLPYGSVAVRTVHRAYPDSQGGLRVKPFQNSETPDLRQAQEESFALSANQTVKNGEAELDEGGGKAELLTPQYVLEDLQLYTEVLDAFVEKHAPVIERGDGIGADMNLGADHMSHMARHITELTGNSSLGARFTGKNLENGGVPGREDATGFGMLTALNTFLEAEGDQIEGKLIVIEGAGNVGSHFARLAHKAGAILVAISDWNGVVIAHNTRRGLVPDKDVTFVGKGIGRYDEELAGLRKDPGDLRQIDADIFTLAGPSISVNAGNVGQIVARRCLFGANTPFDWRAIQTYTQNGGIIYPDPIVNVGGVIGSSIERRNKGTVTKESVHAEIAKRITAATARVIAEAKDPSDYVGATYRRGVRRIHDKDHAMSMA